MAISRCKALIIALLCSLSGAAQTVYPDSLFHLLDDAATDERKISILIDIATVYLDSDLDSSKIFTDQALDLSRKTENESGELKALNLLGNYFQRKSEFDKALTYYEDARSIARQKNYTKGLAITYNNIGIIHTDKGEYPEALKAYQDALDFEIQIPDSNGIAQAYNNIAVVHYYMGNMDNTIEYLERSIAIEEELGNVAVLKKGYNNLGALLEYQGDQDKALEYYHKAYDLSVSINDLREMAIVLNNIAGVYMDNGEFDKAEESYKRSLAIKLEQGDRKGEALHYVNMGSLMLKKGNTAAALANYRKAIAIGDSINAPEVEKEGYRFMYQLYEQTGDYKKALENYQTYSALQDTLRDAEKTRIVADLETKYQTAEKERLLLQEQRKNEALARQKAEADRERAESDLQASRQERMLIGVSGGTLALLFMGLFIIQRNKRRSQAEKDAVIIQEREKGLKAVIEAQEEEKKRIAKELHDGIAQQLSGLKMGWQNLSSSMDNTNEEQFKQLMELTKVLDESAGEVRDLSHRMMPKALEEFGLAEAVSDMLTKTFRYSDIDHEFDHFNLERRFPELVELNLYRITQELVNNALKHARAKRVSVQLFQNKDQLILMVEDDGIGFQGSESDGHGQMNMRSRLRVINGELHYEKGANGGTLATVRVPVG